MGRFEPRGRGFNSFFASPLGLRDAPFRRSSACGDLHPTPLRVNQVHVDVRLVQDYDCIIASLHLAVSHYDCVFVFGGFSMSSNIARRAAATGLAFALTFAATGAGAFDFFGLFGAKDEQPTPRPDAIPYTIEITGLDGKKDIESALKDASNTWRLRAEAPSNGDGLARRVIADFPRLTDVLRASGYYDADIRVKIAGVAVGPDGEDSDHAARAADAMLNKEVATVTVAVDPGPLFSLRRLSVYDARTRAPIDYTLFNKRAFDVGADTGARAATLRTLQTRWIDELRGKSYPLARVYKSEAVVAHKDHVMDATVTIDPGPRAGIGAVELKGSPGIDPDVIRSYIYLEEGEDYSPQKLADTRKSIAKIEAVGSARVEDGDALDANGNLPIVVDTTERKPHAVGVSAQYSTVDGPSVKAYWMDRNLFGGAERLRLELVAGLAPFAGGATFKGFPSLQFSDLIGGLRASFLKPALWGTRNDLLVDAALMRENTNYYRANYGNVTTQIRHRFSDTASVQGGVEIERGHWDDTFGGHDYSLSGFPLSATYDSTDVALVPTRGVRAVVGVTPYVNILPNGVAMIQSKTQISTYQALDEDARYILAGRVGAGSIVGPDTKDIPASRRFFAGGGGSVRGFAYRSLSPTDAAGNYVGGSSLFEASLEARVKVTDAIGVVPFADTGAAFTSAAPNFSTSLRSSVGLGFRYYTGIGPIRLDFATPLNPRAGDPRVAFYFGIGESF